MDSCEFFYTCVRKAREQSEIFAPLLTQPEKNGTQKQSKDIIIVIVF